MKNLLFSHLAALSLILMNTCSVNDNISDDRLVTGDELKVTINDVEKTFNTLVINQQSGDPSNNISGVIDVEARIDNLPDEIIKIKLFTDTTGDNVVFDIKYIKDNQLYYLTYAADVIVNDEDDVSLDFSGNVWKLDDVSELKDIEFAFTDGELTASF